MLKKSALFILSNLGLAFALSGCGGHDNVAACEAWVEKATCGNTNFSTLVACGSYADLDCDISDYFDCLTENFSCDMGVPNTAGWVACAAFAVCE